MRERSHRFSIFISVINCYDRCSLTVDAGRQESCLVKSTATLGASQNLLDLKFHMETHGLFLLHGCMRLGGVVSRLLQQQSWCFQHKTNLLFALHVNL